MVFNNSSSDDSFTESETSQSKIEDSSESDDSFSQSGIDSNQSKNNSKIERTRNVSYRVNNSELAKKVAELKHMIAALTNENTGLKHDYIALNLEYQKVQVYNQTLQSALTSYVAKSTVELNNLISVINIKENSEKSPPVKPLRDILKQRTRKPEEMYADSDMPLFTINEETSEKKQRNESKNSSLHKTTNKSTSSISEIESNLNSTTSHTILAANNTTIKANSPRPSPLSQSYRNRRNVINGEKNGFITTRRGKISKQLDDSYSMENMSMSDAISSTPYKRPVTSNGKSITQNEKTIRIKTENEKTISIKTEKENKSIDQSNDSGRLRPKRKNSSTRNYVEPKLNTKMRRNT